MKFAEQFAEALTPHSTRLNQTIAAAATAVHSKLSNIEKAASDLQRADFGDKHFRIRLSGKLKGENELAEVPINEIWSVQWIAINGVKNKTPAFSLKADSVLFFAALKEGTGLETVGGDIVLLPGEAINLTMEEEGTIEGTIDIIRRKVPVEPVRQQTGPSREQLETVNVHDPRRDIITNPNGIFAETPPETVTVDPTVP